jgi:hypothetical protein
MGVVDGASGKREALLIGSQVVFVVCEDGRWFETGNEVVRASSNRRHHHSIPRLATFPTRPWTPNGTYHNTFAESDTPAGAQTRKPQSSAGGVRWYKRKPCNKMECY